MQRPGYEVVGIGVDGRIYTIKNVTGWQMLPNSGWVDKVSVHPYEEGERTLGIGTDKWLYYWDDVACKQIRVNTKIQMTDIERLPDGTFLCLDTNGSLFKSEDLKGDWRALPSSKKMYDIATRMDGSILGAAKDDFEIYQRHDPESDWQIVHGCGHVISITVMPDGSILGISKDHLVCSRPTLGPDSKWEIVPNMNGVMNLAIRRDGSILGVREDHYVYVMTDFPPGNWVLASANYNLKSITAMPSGSFLGITSESKMVVSSTIEGPWEIVRNGNIEAINKVAILPDGSMVGIGTDYNLWTLRDMRLPHKWEVIPSSGDYTCIDVFSDGCILGVGTNHKLYVRATPTSAWRFIENDRSLSCAAVMPDGSLVGIDTDGYLVRSDTVFGDWVTTKIMAKMIDLTYREL